MAWTALVFVLEHVERNESELLTDGDGRSSIAVVQAPPTACAGPTAAIGGPERGVAEAADA